MIVKICRINDIQNIMSTYMCSVGWSLVFIYISLGISLLTLYMYQLICLLYHVYMSAVILYQNETAVFVGEGVKAVQNK